MTDFLRKRGDINNLLSLFLGIAGLLIIAFFAYNLYNAFRDTDERNAEAFLKGITTKIENLKDGEQNTFLLQGVENWFFMGWGKSDGRASGKPEKCFDSACLCVCKTSTTCQENGFCKKIGDKEFIQFSTAEGVFDSGPVSELFSFDKKVEAVELAMGDKIYIFGEEYFKEGSKAPVRISEKFGQVGEDVDAALFSKSKHMLYLFSGNKYYGYSFVKKFKSGDNEGEEYIYDFNFKQPDTNSLISTGWPGVPDDIDAVFYSPETTLDAFDDGAYFFKDDLYWKFGMKENKVLDGYPKQISENWRGISGPIDAVYRDGTTEIYFIKNSNYYLYRYQYIEGQSTYIGDSDYPTTIGVYTNLGKVNTYLMPEGLFDVMIVKDAGRISFYFGRDIPRQA